MIATIIGFLVLGALSIVLVQMFQRESDILVDHAAQKKTRAIALAGIERAKKELSRDGNWSDTPVTLYNAVSYAGGTYTVTTQNATQNQINVISTGRFGDASLVLTQTIVIDPDPDYPGYLKINMSDMQIAGRTLQRVYLSNERLYFNHWIWIDKVRVVTPANATNDLRDLSLKTSGWYVIWQGRAPPGTLLDVINVVFPGQTQQELRVTFDQDIVQSANITLEIHLSDGAVYQQTRPLN